MKSSVDEHLRTIAYDYTLVISCIISYLLLNNAASYIVILVVKFTVQSVPLVEIVRCQAQKCGGADPFLFGSQAVQLSVHRM